ncbi:HAD-IA family hydrolase [Brevundimonas sp.]|uniref:HAD-IA family hydrolase n=1 Tax=Brevundimonas sp. TaxID=1871086 RepID=UPI001D71A15B|nr:HAD-IA family hydrolase [Brevundimonas sp.]MBA4000472.1 haloacid dehalogenase [Brevundimonas sp.]
MAADAPLAVFDIDGTLVDSRAAILEAATTAARTVGLAEPGYDEVRQIVGLSLHEALRQLAPDLTDAELAEFVAAYQGAFRAMHERPGFEEPLYVGAMDLLDRLRRDGWRLSLATGQSRRGVERNLARAGWADLFLSSHCAEDGPGKPDPAMLVCAMSVCGGAPERTVMIGDTSHDMRMALNAGVRPQGVAWGFHTAEEVLASGAAHVAEDFPALEQALDLFASARRVA